MYSPDKFVQMTCPTYETRNRVHKPGRIHGDTSDSENRLSKVPQSKTTKGKKKT